MLPRNAFGGGFFSFQILDMQLFPVRGGKDRRRTLSAGFTAMTDRGVRYQLEGHRNAKDQSSSPPAEWGNRRGGQRSPKYGHGRLARPVSTRRHLDGM